MKTIGDLEAEGLAGLKAAKARVRATETALQAAIGHGQIFMMAVGAAERMKLLRARQRSGIRVAQPEIEEIPLIDRLIDDGRISEDASADPKMVDAAISKLLRDYCSSALRVTLRIESDGLASKNNQEITRHVRPKARSR